MNEPLNIMRHVSVFNPNEHMYPIHIIGAGATGSRVFAALVELGYTSINVYDPDTVEEHNLANQIYLHRHIGMPKVQACRDWFALKLGIDNVDDVPGKFFDIRVTQEYAKNHLCNGIVFLLTDDMASRRSIMAGLIGRHETSPLLVIETRMASTHGNIFCVDPFDELSVKRWQTTLVDDTDEDNIELSPCGTTLSVGTTASLIANYAVWQMMHFFTDRLALNEQTDLFFRPTVTATLSEIAA
jgi:hypothetical protein